MSKTRVLCAGLLCAVLAYSGCENTTSENLPAAAPAKVRKFGRHRKTRETTAPVTCEECQRIAMAITGCLENQNLAAAEALVDWDGIIAKSARGRKLPAGGHEELLQSFMERGGVFGEIEAILAAGGTLSLLSFHYDEPADAGIWYRVTTADQVLIYLDLKLARRADGQVRICDVLNSMRGDSLSNILQQVVAHLLELHESSLAGDQRRHEESLRTFKWIVQLHEHLDRKNYTAAMDVYRQLPREVQVQKRLIARRLEFAMHLGANEQRAAIEVAEAHNSPPGTLDGLLMYHYHQLGDAEAVNVCVDRLNRMVGGDPELTNVRVLRLLDLGRMENARSESDLAVWMWPASQSCVSTALIVAQRQRDFARMIDILTALEASGFELPDLANLDFYAELRNSSEFHAWQTARAEAALAESDDQPTEEVAAEYSAWPRVQ